MSSNHFIEDGIFKGIRSIGERPGSPFFEGKSGGQQKGQFGGLYVGPGKEAWGPKGGHIKGVSPVTGKKIYYKKWQPGQGKEVPNIVQPRAGSPAPEGYDVHPGKFDPHHIIGTTKSGKPIFAHAALNHKQNYRWDDHRDAGHAHYVLASYLMNLIRQKKNAGKKTEGLERLVDIHHMFSRHHREQSVKRSLQKKDNNKDK